MKKYGLKIIFEETTEEDCKDLNRLTVGKSKQETLAIAGILLGMQVPGFIKGLLKTLPTDVLCDLDEINREVLTERGAIEYVEEGQ